MAPPAKKASTGAAAKPKASHASYQDMITDAIVNLKDRKGSSRQSLKKYVKNNNTLNATDNMFDALFNKALKAGVDKGIFEQPKGPSGGTKLAKKTAAPVEKKPAAAAATTTKKEPAAKKPAAKKATTATKKTTTAKKPAATAAKKAAPAKKAAAPKKAAPAVPAKAEKPETVLTKTKSGRVAKTQKPVAKKPAPKKAATTKKKATAKA